jgi:hypothetical protein
MDALVNPKTFDTTHRNLHNTVLSNSFPKDSLPLFSISYGDYVSAPHVQRGCVPQFPQAMDKNCLTGKIEISLTYNFASPISKRFPKNSPIDQSDETVESERRDRRALRSGRF